ncbi:hypothetical protein GCM10010271_68130 [Streptomyces kurssanovii]|nr:hypothetical protein GCM10010271_68130 [Streptomyces kurssanovii]
MADLHNVCTEGGLYTRQGTLPTDITDPEYLRFKAAQEKTERDLIERLRFEVDVDEHLKN